MIAAHMRWIMLVSGILTTIVLYAAVAPQAALTSTFGEALSGVPCRSHRSKLGCPRWPDRRNAHLWRVPSGTTPHHPDGSSPQQTHLYFAGPVAGRPVSRPAGSRLGCGGLGDGSAIRVVSAGVAPNHALITAWRRASRIPSGRPAPTTSGPRVDSRRASWRGCRAGSRCW